jgi:hypothetical protein
MEPWITFLILIPIGIAVGIVAALSGLGGGILMVPILYFGIFTFAEVISNTWAYATTISSTVIIFTAISGTIAFSIQKRVDYVVGLTCAPFTIAGAFIGKYTQQFGGEIFLKAFFVVLLVLTAIRMIYKVVKTKRMKAEEQGQVNPNSGCPPKTEINGENLEVVQNEPSRYRQFLDKLTLQRQVDDNCEQQWKYKAKLYLAPVALIGGYVASTAGVGGGIIMVPVLHILIGLPMHFATATSVFIMIFTKSTTVITAYATPSVITEGIWWPFAIGLAIGIIGGVQGGALLAKRIKADPLKIFFAILLVGAAIWTVIRMILFNN